MSAIAMTSSSPVMTAGADLPFLTVSKDGKLVESMCLAGLESIVLGRHTNCDLIVTHPSVSRHHLEIQVIHGSRELLLTDLDSIHGTWINGKQALPLVSVTATEGDTIKLGASSRSYRVQWRPHPPQNSTSSEECSDNSDSPLDCKGSKQYGAAESRTTMESRKTSQMKSNKASQTAYISTKSSNVLANLENKQEEAGLQEYEKPMGPLENSKGACAAEGSVSLNCEVLQETMLCRPAKVKFAAESLAIDENACIPKDWARFDDDIWQDEVNGIQKGVKGNLQSSFMEKGNKKKVIDLACFDGGDGRENIQKAEELSMQESNPALFDLGVNEEESKENIDFNESKPFNTILPSAGASRLPFTEMCFDGNDGGENVDFQEAKDHRMLESEEASSGFSKLWLRRSKSNPPPNLKTSTSPCSTIPSPLKETNKICLLPSAPPMPFTYLINNPTPSAPPMPFCVAVGDKECLSGDFQIDDAKENNHPSDLCYQERSKHNCPYPLSKSAEKVEDYVSDKENDSPVYGHGCNNIRTSINKAQEEALHQERSRSAATEASRRPFQPLVLMAHGDCKTLSPCVKNLSGEENSITQTKKRLSPVIQNLDSMLRKLKGVARSEVRRAWHIVVDITCFLDSSSFQSLKQLEGIREVRLIIPKIVISELDIRRGIGKPRQKALKWIESCMVKLPAWIHVQNSSENLPIAATPPVSPLSGSVASIYSGSFDNMMSPTNGDHVLNCALLFNSTVSSGQVALLTNDIALKIKAMAEGLVCESPSAFCESLLSPYSSRFLWQTSIAHGHSWPEKSFHSKSILALAPSVHSSDQSTKEVVISTVKAMSFRKNHAVEGLKKECCKQAQGLRVALAS